MSKTILPPQTGAAGKFLKSDGTDATFETIEQSDVSGLGTSLDSKADLTYVDAQLAEKANKVQEAWQTPTLLNGATNGSVALRYYKDNMGVVRFKGNVVIANPTLPFMSLPAGYRLEGKSRVFPLWNYATLAYGRLNCGNGVDLTAEVSSGNTVSLDAVSFKGEA